MINTTAMATEDNTAPQRGMLKSVDSKMNMWLTISSSEQPDSPSQP